MRYTIKKRTGEEQIRHWIADCAVGKDEVVGFRCACCGKCCGNRNENPILINAVDLYHLAKGFGIPTDACAEKYTNTTIGYNSRLPVLALASDYRGRCKLLYDGRCTAHRFKPTVCALYPLGRAPGESGFIYFIQDNITCGTKNPKETVTLQQWLDSFQIEERDEESIHWKTFTDSLIQRIRGRQWAKQDDTYPSGAKELLKQYLYCFDCGRDLTEQIKDREKEENIDALLARCDTFAVVPPKE